MVNTAYREDIFEYGEERDLIYCVVRQGILYTKEIFFNQMNISEGLVFFFPDMIVVLIALSLGLKGIPFMLASSIKFLLLELLDYGKI